GVFFAVDRGPSTRPAGLKHASFSGSTFSAKESGTRLMVRAFWRCEGKEVRERGRTCGSTLPPSRCFRRLDFAPSLSQFRSSLVGQRLVSRAAFVRVRPH